MHALPEKEMWPNYDEHISELMYTTTWKNTPLVTMYLRHRTQRVVDLGKPQQTCEKQRRAEGEEKLRREEVLLSDKLAQ